MDTVEFQRIAELQDANRWHRERRRVLARELRSAAMPGRAVDIGAGGGGNTRVLRDHGWQAIAIDLSAAAVARCLAQGLEAYQGDARYLPLPSREQDLALALNVLEHVEDDVGAMEEIARVLRPGGTALIAVPCDMALWSAHDVELGRVRRYSRHDLATLVEDAGLQVDRMWSWNVLVRPLVRLRRHRPGHREDLANLPPALGRAMHLLTVVERYLPVATWPGVTLFARARRPWI